MDNTAKMFESLSGDERAATAPNAQSKSNEKDQGEAITPVPDDAPQDIPFHRLGVPSLVHHYHDANGKPLQKICRWDKPDGTKEFFPLTFRKYKDSSCRWTWKGLPEPRPIYGLDRLALNPYLPVVVCEGEKSADAAQKLFPDYVAITSQNGSGSAHKADWTVTQGRAVTIWPDNDKAGDDYAADVATLTQQAGAKSVHIVKIPDGAKEGWDLADDLPEGWTLEKLRELLNDPAEHKQPYIPFGYVMRETGVFKLDESSGNDIAVCDPLYIEALARDDKGNSWGCLLVWKDADGKSHEWAMPNSMLAGDGSDYRRALLDMGLRIRAGKKAQNALHDYIISANPEARAVSVNMPGWNGQRYVALDGAVYGKGSDRVLLQMPGVLPKLDKKGTLESWQKNVACYAVDNSRLVLATSAAFAGALLRPANEGSGGFHFSGGSSTGKTTTLRFGSSVSGLALRSWRTTDNAAESWARSANDGILLIDELGQVDGKAADQMAYMLGNGQTKGRANREGMAKDTTEFLLLFLSTGEIGLAEKIGEGKKKAKAGQTVRMLEIPADAGKGFGIFEELHDFKNGDEFAKHLAKASADHRGCAMPVWLEKLAGMDGDKLRAALATMTKAWMDEHVPPDADGQVKRAARRFALVAVAGELATTLGITSWPDKEASNAAARCFKDWLSARGGSGSHEVQDGIKDILAFIEKHGSSRFQEIGKSETVYDRAGFKKDNGDGEYEFYLRRDAFQSEILGGSRNADNIIKAAIDAGLIIPDSDGKTTRPVTLPGLGKKRVLCIIPARYKSEAIA